LFRVKKKNEIFFPKIADKDVFFPENCISVEKNSVWPWVARFFIVQHTKTEKIYQVAVKFIKLPQNLPKVRNINQMAIK
jgi:hypothetical protein